MARVTGGAAREGRIYAIFRSTFVVSFLGNGVGRARRRRAEGGRGRGYQLGGIKKNC